MTFSFTYDDISKITGVLGSAPKVTDDENLFRLVNPDSRQSLTLSLHNFVSLGENAIGALVVVQTQHGYFEMHGCSGFMIFEPDEIIFVSAHDEFVSCMVVGKQCTCSLFSNVRREILSADFSELDPRVLMSAMQLSLTEAIFEV